MSINRSITPLTRVKLIEDIQAQQEVQINKIENKIYLASSNGYGKCLTEVGSWYYESRLNILIASLLREKLHEAAAPLRRGWIERDGKTRR